MNLRNKIIEKFIKFDKFIVFFVEPLNFIPFDSSRVRGQISIDMITRENSVDIIKYFPEKRVDVFREKLKRGEIGIYVRHKGNVVGYMWRKDYDTRKRVKADGYIPLSGTFCHINFARVTEHMKGRGLQLLMLTWLINDAFSKGIPRIYTDMEHTNLVSMRNVVKIGFVECFRLFVVRVVINNELYNFSIKYRNKNSSY